MINSEGPSRASTNTPDGTPRSNNSEIATVIKKRRIKLPEAPLSQFDGKYENWLSFKNAFNNMIGTQSDLSDIDKLHYLKAALVGDAANKTNILAVDGVNYTQAWELLERLYEVKRILISRHIASILNLPALDKEMTNGLTKLADDAQQHVASLRALGVDINSEIVVHVLESKIPKATLEKWEATLDRDEFPKVDQIYEFLYKTAVCASKRERMKAGETQGRSCEVAIKKKYPGAANKAFVINTARGCIVCKNKKHPLFLCDKFKALSVMDRIDTVRKAKLCYNCLRLHRDQACKFSNCTICNKRHNTLLHREDLSNTNKTNANVNTV